MDAALATFVLAALLAYLYAFMSGFTDAANAIATAVGTRALSPLQAVLVAAVFELCGALTGTAVALTIGKGIVAPEVLAHGGIAAALLGAMTWSFVTYRRGIPVSETHGLIGALIGVGLFTEGTGAVVWSSVVPVLAAILISPALGALGAMLLLALVYHAFQRASRKLTTPLFRNLQRLSAMFMAFSHGRNDAQKPMGVLAVALAAYHGSSQPYVPLWVIVSVAAVAGLGVALGGWRIIRTLGKGLTEVKPAQGFSAEASTASTILASSALGFALSTTQVASGSVIGSGLGRRGSKVRWRTVGRITVGWLLTLPAAGAVGAAAALLVVWFGGWGIAVDAILAVVVILGLFWRSRRSAVNAANAMSDVAESGRAVKVKRNPPPTRRQRAIAREEARRKAAADAAARKSAKRAKAGAAKAEHAERERLKKESRR